MSGFNWIATNRELVSPTSEQNQLDNEHDAKNKNIVHCTYYVLGESIARTLEIATLGCNNFNVFAQSSSEYKSEFWIQIDTRDLEGF